MEKSETGEETREVELEEMEKANVGVLEALPFARAGEWDPVQRTRLQVQWDGVQVKKAVGTGSFSEGNIFQELFPGHTKPSHRALDDCLGLLSICLRYGKPFLHQLQTQGQTFHNIHPMK